MAVRKERVVLELEDRFTSQMARAAAATALLDKELHGLSGRAVESQKVTRSLADDTDDLGKSAKNTSRDLDRYSGRLRILADIAAAVGPSFVPIGAIAVPAVTGLASALGFATVGLGTTVLAFQGFGEAMKAVNKAALEPTADNIDKARIALEALSPEARQFALQLRGMLPELQHLRDLASEGIFPGLSRGLDGLTAALPRVELLISAISEALGDIAGDAGESLGSERWAPFLDFLATEGPEALSDLATAAGNTAHALAGLWMATTPLNDDFSKWLVRVTEDFDNWAAGLSQTEGFKEFIAYIRENGPRVAEAAGAVGDAILQIVEAIAPLGGPSLQIIESLADALASIADSPLGTPLFGLVAALGTANTAVRLFNSLRLKAFGGPAIDLIKKNTGAIQGYAGATRGLNTAMGLLGKGFAAFAILQTIDGFSQSLGDGGQKIRNYIDTVLQLAGPNVASQLAAVNDEIEKQSKLADAFGPDFTLPLIGWRVAPFDFTPNGKGWQEADDKVRALKETRRQLQHQMELEKIASQNATDATIAFGDASVTVTSDLDKLRAATAANAQAAHETAGQFLSFGESLDDSKVSLGDWITELNEQANALRDFTENARTAGERGLRKGLIAELEKAGPAGALRLKQLANASESEIRRANRAWRNGREAMREYVAFKVPPKKIIVDTAEATARLQALQRFLNGLRAPNITVPSPRGQLFPTITPADGTTVPGVRFPYGDRVPALLAPGEEVISNRHGQADRHRDLLKAINANRMASGGTAGGPRSPLSAYIRNDLDLKFPRTLAQWERALKRSEKAIDREREKRDDLVSARNDLASSTRDAFRSDLFNLDRPDGWEWMSASQRAATATSPLDILRRDIANASTFQSVLSGLQKRGLDGQAFGALAGSGDLAQAQMFAGFSNAQLAEYERLYNQRQKVTAGVGAFAGNVVYGKEIAESNEHLKVMVKQGAALEKRVHAVEKAVRDHSARGKASKRSSAASVRTGKKNP